MSIKAKLEDAIKLAMKQRSDDLVTLRTLMAKAKDIAKAKNIEVSDEHVTQALIVAKKELNEAIALICANGREAEKEKAQMIIVESFLPKQVSKEEIVADVKSAIEEKTITLTGTPKDKGAVSAFVNKKYYGAFDSKVMPDIFKELGL